MQSNFLSFPMSKTEKKLPFASPSDWIAGCHLIYIFRYENTRWINEKEKNARNSNENYSD